MSANSRFGAHGRALVRWTVLTAALASAGTFAAIGFAKRPAAAVPDCGLV